MSSDNTDITPRRGRLGVFLPLIGFFVISGFFFYALKTGDPSRLPSVLIGKPVPVFNLPPVEGLAINSKPVSGFSNKDLATGKVTIVNVWASWCVPCHAEHPILTKLAADNDVPLYGINYKDKPVDARRFLGRLGNPYIAVGADAKGRTAIDWGVYGVPETYIIDGTGKIAYKHVGPLTDMVIKARILPAIEKARASPQPSPKN